MTTVVSSSQTFRLDGVLPEMGSDAAQSMVDQIYRQIAPRVQALRGPTSFEMELDAFGMIGLSREQQVAVRDGLLARFETAGVGRVEVRLLSLSASRFPITRPSHRPRTIHVPGLVVTISPK